MHGRIAKLRKQLHVQRLHPKDSKDEYSLLYKSSVFSDVSHKRSSWQRRKFGEDYTQSNTSDKSLGSRQ